MSCSSPSASGRAGLVALALLLVGAPAPSPAAAAAKKPVTRSLCVDKVTVRDSPRGFAVAHLARPQKLLVVSREKTSSGATWALVRSKADDVSGWIPEGALCRGR